MSYEFFYQKKAQKFLTAKSAKKIIMSYEF